MTANRKKQRRNIARGRRVRRYMKEMVVKHGIRTTRIGYRSIGKITAK